MKTAEEIITRIVLTGFDLPDAINLIKQYGKQCAKEALNDADNKIHGYINYNQSAYHVSYNKASELISEVEIKTP